MVRYGRFKNQRFKIPAEIIGFVLKNWNDYFNSLKLPSHCYHVDSRFARNIDQIPYKLHSLISNKYLKSFEVVGTLQSCSISKGEKSWWSLVELSGGHLSPGSTHFFSWVERSNIKWSVLFMNTTNHLVQGPKSQYYVHESNTLTTKWHAFISQVLPNFSSLPPMFPSIFLNYTVCLILSHSNYIILAFIWSVFVFSSLLLDHGSHYSYDSIPRSRWPWKHWYTALTPLIK